ncbi:hypothetical protein T4C_9836 [Trichinella pseudospiralis]|uniref:Uncharacterized protein n=1 Tax=Trichinella pseudospiralis TaxID=6337 RepID=A0A0V1INI8_TRIPS|nr:hypothetical protein T4C_8234 [Trichinella pseudospiralis]KRZ24205.1 hypothetical protein T4C_9836 [Trichinella pseudospiralis]
MKSSKPHGTADGCAIQRSVRIYFINFTEDAIRHPLMLALSVCFNLTNWKSTEISFFSVNTDLSIVFDIGRQPSLRQELDVNSSNG